MILFLCAIAIGISLVMTIAWAIAVRTGQSGWIDAIWSFCIGGFGVLAAFAPAGVEGVSARQFLVAAMVALWSLRLGLHIVARTRRGGDDPRYKQLRAEWGDAFKSRLFWFLQIQAAVALVLVLSVMVSAHRPGPLGLLDGLGIVVLAAAIVGEGIADRQLSRFSRNPDNKDRVCDTGLWSWSRHPNYFFEWLAWLAYVAIAIDWTGNYLFGWFALAAPVLMYWLLVYASGIPPLEAHMLRSRGDAFLKYQARVSAFWLLPPFLSNRSTLTHGRPS